MTSVLTHKGTTVDGDWVCGDTNSDGGDRKLNACDPQLRETWQNYDLMGPQQGAPKSRRITDSSQKVYYPYEMNVESVEAADEHIQEAWPAIDRLTKDLTEKLTDITLDFREMLCGTDEVLDATQSEEMLGELANAMVQKCTRLTQFNVNIVTQRLNCYNYIDDDYDNQTTDSQWWVIGNIMNLIQKVVGEATTLTSLDLFFELVDTNVSFPIVIKSFYHSETKITIDRNMLSLAFAKWIVDQYKELFTTILTNETITSLAIQMMGMLPVLVGALGAVAETIEHRI